MIGRATLPMVDMYRRAGRRPTQLFVQSWYPHPTEMLLGTAAFSCTASSGGTRTTSARSAC